MTSAAADLAQRLAGTAEAVCRHYLSNGTREGNYWLVGDVANTPGRSLYVRLAGPRSGKGAAGKWADAATGEHGDLLDLIAAIRGLTTLRDALDEARCFMSMPRAEFADSPAPTGSPEAARRLFAMSKPISGTLAQAYLQGRNLPRACSHPALRFHPNCYYRPARDDAPDVQRAWPALIAAVTDNDGRQTGTHRIWLDPRSRDKAAVATPRKAMGELLGHGVRFGSSSEVMVAGEGIETMLSLREALPILPAIAALSSAHLAALAFPTQLRRLYIANDRDAAGNAAFTRLRDRAAAVGIEAVPLMPVAGDFNDDLCQRGIGQLRAGLRVQILASDVERLFSMLPRSEPACAPSHVQTAAHSVRPGEPAPAAF